MSRQLTSADLQQHLRDQVGFLLTSVELFDHGDIAEAKRMAVNLRVIAHDTPKSHSLLDQLNLLYLLFYDSCSVDVPGNLMSHTGLVATRVKAGPEGSSVDFVPILDSNLAMGKARVAWFEDWWQGIVIRDSSGVTFTRRSLVLDIANKDGGAHVDSQIPDDYSRLSRDGSVGWTKDVGCGEEPMLGVELASVRQITHELLVTLACQVRDSFPKETARQSYGDHRLKADPETDQVIEGDARLPIDSLPRQG